MQRRTPLFMEEAQVPAVGLAKVPPDVRTCTWKADVSSTKFRSLVMPSQANVNEASPIQTAAPSILAPIGAHGPLSLPVTARSWTSYEVLAVSPVIVHERAVLLSVLEQVPAVGVAKAAVPVRYCTSYPVGVVPLLGGLHSTVSAVLLLGDTRASTGMLGASLSPTQTVKVSLWRSCTSKRSSRTVLLWPGL